MSKKTEHLRSLKLELAAKYERLSINTKSKPRRKAFRYRADKFRREAAALT